MPNDRLIRRLVPSLPPLTRNRLLMAPPDLLDRVLCWPWPEFRALPPNRMRLRIGVQNRILFNAAAFRTTAIHFWMAALARGHARLDFDILDLGSGCGRFAMPLRDLRFWGRGFRGTYLGIDIDAEMLAWCRAHFDDRFAWHDAGQTSRTYRPHIAGPGGDGGGVNRREQASDPSPRAHDSAPPLRLPGDDGSRDLALANSLFSHLLEDDFAAYAHEVARLLRPGGWFYLTAFVREHVAAGGRWTFRHRQGEAWIESQRYPEAAVAYETAWIRRTLREAGFRRIRITPAPAQSLICCRKPPERAA